jgi:hypothetical protein
MRGHLTHLFGCQKGEIFFYVEKSATTNFPIVVMKRQADPRARRNAITDSVFCSKRTRWRRNDRLCEEKSERIPMAERRNMPTTRSRFVMDAMDGSRRVQTMIVVNHARMPHVQIMKGCVGIPFKNTKTQYTQHRNEMTRRTMMGRRNVNEETRRMLNPVSAYGKSQLMEHVTEPVPASFQPLQTRVLRIPSALLVMIHVQITPIHISTRDPTDEMMERRRERCMDSGVKEFSLDCPLTSITQ